MASSLCFRCAVERTVSISCVGATLLGKSGPLTLHTLGRIFSVRSLDREAKRTEARKPLVTFRTVRSLIANQLRLISDPKGCEPWQQGKTTIPARRPATLNRKPQLCFIQSCSQPKLSHANG